MRNGREVKTGKKYEYMIVDRKRILMVHNVTEEDVGIYECALADDKISLQLSLKGTHIKEVKLSTLTLSQSKVNNLTAKVSVLASEPSITNMHCSVKT